MNKKYIKYMEYIVKDIELPYLKYLEQYGLKQDEMELVLSKVYNQPVSIKESVTIEGRSVYDTQGNKIYYENSYGFWEKYKYDTNGNIIYYENSYGYWRKWEYDEQGKIIYYENSDGEIEDNR